jgi:hypothetical protein
LFDRPKPTAGCSENEEEEEEEEEEETMCWWVKLPIRFFFSSLPF